jgi:hypothetical protein
MLPGQQPHDSSMQRLLLPVLLWAASLAAVTPAFAWTSAPARNPANGHYYAFFTGFNGDTSGSYRQRPPMPFANALTRAASMSHLGVPGHLATITSQIEQDFVRQYFLELSRFPSPRLGRDELAWIAASDAAVEGEWRWVAGPEAGQQFWQGNRDGIAIGHQNWTSFNGRFYEPNDSNRPYGEDFVALNLSLYSQSESWWNDVSTRDDGMTFVPRMGLVEFSPIPEPSSVVLIGSVFIAIFAARRNRFRYAVAESYTLGR